MARRRRTKTPTSPGSPSSITQSLVHLVSITGRTAVRDVQEVGAQLLTMARDAVRGTQSASGAIAGDVAGVARRTVSGIGRGIEELSQDVARLSRMARKPGARMASRRRQPEPRRRRASSGKATKAS
jgi:hypothetical protein